MKISTIDKREFCYRFRFIFEQLPEQWFPHPKKHGSASTTVKWIAALARAELGYSPKTIDVDIEHHLEGIYKTLINKD